MSVVRQFVIYGISGAASRLAAILLVPLYTRTLSVRDYGQLEVLLALYMLAVLLVGLQSESALARDYHQAAREGTQRRLVWGSLAMTMAGSVALLAIILPLVWLNLLPANVAEALPWLLAMTLPAQLLGIQLVMLRFAGAPVRFALLSFLDLGLSAFFSFVLIVMMGWGIFGALAGIAIGKILCVVLAWPITFRLPSRAGPSRALLRQMAHYALPTMPSVLLNWAQTNGNRILLAIFLTLSDVALAGIAIKVAALYGFLTYSFRLAWEPYSFEKLTALASDPGIYNRAFQWYVLGMFLAAGLATLVSPLLVSILAPSSYRDAAELSGYFIIGQFWVGAISILCIGIHGARRTSLLTHVYGAGAIVNMLLLAVLSNLIGVAAAAWGFMISAMLSALLAARYSETHFRTGFSGRFIALTLIATGLFAMLSQLMLGGIPTTASWSFGPALPYFVLAGSLLTILAAIAAIGLERGRLRVMWGELTAARRAGVPTR